MKTALKSRISIIAALFIAGIIGFWLLVHMTTGQDQSCKSVISIDNISIKLI